jgi:hypothetical protein
MPQDFQDNDPPQDEEEYDDEEEDEAQAAAQRAADSVQTPERAPDPVPAAAIGVGRPVDRDGKPRPRKKKKDREQRETKPRQAHPEEPREADLFWPYVMKEAEGKGVDPGYVDIRIARVDVGRETTVGYLSGDAVLGDDNETPSEALYNAIVDQFHIASGARGPVLYNVTFSIPGDRGFSHRKQLKLPPPSEINKRRHQEWYPGNNYGAPEHVPPPPRRARRRDERDYEDRDRDRDRGRRDRDDRDRDYDYRDDRRGLGAPPPQYPPPQYGPRGYDDRYDRRRGEDRLERELDDLKRLVREVLLRGPQQQGQPQPQQGLDMVALTNYIQTIEKNFGVKLTVAGLGAPPAAQLPAAPPRERDPESLEFEQTIARKVRQGVGKRIDSLLEEALDPRTAQRRRAAEEEEEEEEDKPETSFDVVEVPGMTYPGTDQPIRYAADKETGDVDAWKTAALYVPTLLHQHGDKALEVIGKFADAFKGMGLSGRGRPQMPAHAEGMNGTGVGRPPPYQPPPQQQPQQSPPPKPPGDDDDFRF